MMLIKANFSQDTDEIKNIASVQAKQFTQEAVENFECDFNRTELIRMMREDGFGELNWEDLKSQLNKINYECLDGANK